MFSLKGKVAFVTGAARGLGYEIAKAYAAEGAALILHARKIEDAKKAAQNIKGSITPIAGDLSDFETVESLLIDIPKLDILVNNVGSRNRGDIDSFSQKDLEEMMQVNTLSAFQLSRQAARIMKKQKSGKIINISSIAAQIARGDLPYTMSKGAIESMTRGLAAELGPYNITANAIAPGYFGTETNQDMVNDSKIAEWLEKRTSLGRWAKPQEISGAAVFLASDAASYITGHTLNVDGGYVTHF